MRTITTTIRTIAHGGLVLLLGGLIATATPLHARADVGFAATGSAFGARMIVRIPAAPLTPTPVDVGGPTAQATLDSIGNMRGLAAMPYPGDLVLSGPGLAAGFVATTPLGAALSKAPALPALPAYPFYVQADTQKPKDSASLPYADMQSSAGPDAVAATVRAPGSPEDAPSSMRAVSTIRRLPGGGVITSSTTTITGLHAGPLTVGSVTSTAEMELHPDGSTTRRSSFAARALDIGGTAVDVTPDGFSVGGSPLPVTVAKSVSDALEGAGIDVALLPASQTPTSTVGAALQITRHQDFGPAGQKGSITLILGQAAVSLSGAPSPMIPVVGIVPTVSVPSIPAPVASLPGTGSRAPAPVGGVPNTSGPAAPLPVTTRTQPPPPAASVLGAGARHPVAERFDAAPAYWAIAGAVVLTVLVGPGVRLVLKALSAR